MSVKTFTYGEVIQKDTDDPNKTGCLDRSSDTSCDHLHNQIPSPFEIIAMNSMSKKGKAPGEDLCSGNVLSCFAMDLMHIYYPLILKTYVRIQPPIHGMEVCCRSFSKVKVVRVFAHISEMSCWLVLMERM